MDTADVVAGLAAELAAAGARDEALAVHEPAARRLGVLPRRERFRPAGRAWRLGEFLITPDARLLRVGRVVRVANTTRRRSVVANAITEHHRLAVLARRSGFPEGETVNFDWERLDPRDAGVPDLAGYLGDRADLLLHPPAGA